MSREDFRKRSILLEGFFTDKELAEAVAGLSAILSKIEKRHPEKLYSTLVTDREMTNDEGGKLVKESWPKSRKSPLYFAEFKA